MSSKSIIEITELNSVSCKIKAQHFFYIYLKIPENLGETARKAASQSKLLCDPPVEKHWLEPSAPTDGEQSFKDTSRPSLAWTVLDTGGQKQSAARVEQ